MMASTIFYSIIKPAVSHYIRIKDKREEEAEISGSYLLSNGELLTTWSLASSLSTVNVLLP